MPLNKLIPTIPLRLNYILWIEDLLSLTEQSETVKGIDIGTGASCIYPLLAAKKNKWTMIATEKDRESIICAKDNVEKNSLGELIRIVEVKGENLLQGVVDEEVYDFCMCNPPFFSSTQELHPFFKSRKSKKEKKRKIKISQGELTSCEINCSVENNESIMEEPGEEHSNNLTVFNNNNDSGVKSPGKRMHNESFDGICMKKLKISAGNSDIATVFFKFMIAIKMDESNISLELDCIEESDNREYLHQILQYIKNNLKV
ncbi:hypothetical protein NQ314_013308 [Rhamnusium bicolor]|uniref:U6 small nuclear RNA (adenine-(43)-N(6))-methyltransferase n=1 Tax=Rhamnusium bicolor TaxID=1586634 RepID=A0AAV8X7W5_9CUCU|nr:hypothetical protein NQ314_013308 [Rhamnusium bicolor]